MLEDFPAERPQLKATRHKQVNLETNMFKYKGPVDIYHHYLVTFTPEIHRKRVFDVFMNVYRENKADFPCIAFDGINMLVTKEKMDDKNLTYGTEKPIEVSIIYKGSCDMKDLDKGVDVSRHIQCLEVISRSHQRINCITDGLKVYGEDSSGGLGIGIELRTGLVHNFKIVSFGLLLNVDTVFGAYYKCMSLIDLITEMVSESRGRRSYESKRSDINLNRTELGRSFWLDVEKFLRNVRVRTTHRSPANRELIFKIDEIAQIPATQIEFEYEGKLTTVAMYFSKVYSPLKYPSLPLAVIKKKNLTLHIPLEVLEIFPNQKYVRKLDEDQTAGMIKYAALTPINRFKIIKDKLNAFKILNNKEVEEFGMAFDSNFEKCIGKIMKPPKLHFKNRDIEPSNGSWNLKGLSAIKPVYITNWMFIAFRGSTDQYSRDISNFMTTASSFGVEFKNRPVIRIVEDLEQFKKMSKPAFCMIVLPDKSSHRYEEIKRHSETYENVITQCILQKNIEKLSNPTFASNVLLKINAKMGGTNSTLSIYSDIIKIPTLILGIDVYHPGVNDIDSPSIVAIVGSMSADLASHRTIIRQQPRRQEIVTDLKSVTREMLITFKKKLKSKPRQIIVFRDGVGDSMFHSVFHTEIMSIKEACASLEASYAPKITFIVSQKRHSVRFNTGGTSGLEPSSSSVAYRKKGAQKSEDRPIGRETGNCVPGTVVDSIGHPDMFDFYLVSHHALQGTARPVRYTVLLNESKFETEQLQEFVYSLCYLYARATKSVSAVPSTYYAHLAAARGKCYLERDDKDDKLVMRKNKDELNDRLFYL